MKIVKCLLSFCCLVFIICPASLADLYWESQITGMPGSAPDSTLLTKTYQTEYGMRIEKESEVTIANYKTGKLYTLDTQKKTYSIMNFDEFLKGKGDKESEETAAQMKQMMEEMMKSVSIEKTEETKEINGYKCTKFFVTMMGIKSEYWVTKDVKEHLKLAEAMKKYENVMNSNPTLQSMLRMSDMFQKLEGFPIMTITEFGNMKSTQKVIKVVEEKLKESLFEPPSDYAKVEAH